jgi:hypothetical protein
MSEGTPRNPKEREVMSPQGIGITTYKARVALEKPCKKRWGIVIGQSKDSERSHREP